MLILPIYDLGRSFHHFISPSISFYNDLKLLSYDLKLFSYKSFICLVRVTPRYFFYGLWLLWRDLLPWFHLKCLSFESRKATDLFEVIVFPDTLLKNFFSCSYLLVEFLGLLMYTTVSSANNYILIFFLSNLYPHDLLLLSYCFN